MYRTNDGQPLGATTPEGIVKELHKISFTQSDNDRKFMKETQGRVLLQTGKRVRCGSAEDFVADLVRIGLLVDETETTH
jgi:hypothetical protein